MDVLRPQPPPTPAQPPQPGPQPPFGFPPMAVPPGMGHQPIPGTLPQVPPNGKEYVVINVVVDILSFPVDYEVSIVHPFL